MNDLLNSPRCHTCQKSIHHPEFMKTIDGRPLYHTDPKISLYTKEKLLFCGPPCATAWHLEQIEAHK
jgi:hypothetical protein